VGDLRAGKPAPRLGFVHMVKCGLHCGYG
jgi:hypothetical protein